MKLPSRFQYSELHLKMDVTGASVVLMVIMLPAGMEAGLEVEMEGGIEPGKEAVIDQGMVP